MIGIWEQIYNSNFGIMGITRTLDCQKSCIFSGNLNFYFRDNGVKVWLDSKHSSNMIWSVSRDQKCLNFL